MEQDDDGRESEFALRASKAEAEMGFLGREEREATARKEAKPSIVGWGFAEQKRKGMSLALC